jgi:hypothetical protein
MSLTFEWKVKEQRIASCRKSFILFLYVSVTHSCYSQIDGIKGHHFDLYQKSIQSHQDLVKYLMGFLEEESGFAKGYEVILESGKELIGDILRHMVQNLSSSSRNAMIVHCTAGKDRTGVFIMLLLGLCGVDDEIIAREYGLSSIGHYGKQKHKIQDYILIYQKKKKRTSRRRNCKECRCQCRGNECCVGYLLWWHVVDHQDIERKVWLL